MQVNSASQQYYVSETPTVSSTKATSTEDKNKNEATTNTVKTDNKKEAPYPIISAIDEQLEESFKKFKKEFSPEAAIKMEVLFGSSEGNKSSALNNAI